MPDPRADLPTLGPDPPPPDPAAPLGRVGRFELRAYLGRGAYGAVYRALDPHLDREVALKLPHAAGDAHLREARAASRLKHPNIVAVYEAGTAADGRGYIASELVAGVPLSVRLADGPVPWREAAALVRDLAGAMAYAHSEGVVHRDLKPANVMLTAGRVQVMDFGLAAAPDATAAGPVGTPGYMAPEQCGGGPVGPAADQYALGVVLYEALTGRRPVGAEPVRPQDLAPDVPGDLEAACARAMSAAPADRYPDCAALADDLRRCLTGEAVLARRQTTLAAVARWARRHPVLATVGLTAAVWAVLGPPAALVLGALAVGFALRTGPNPSVILLGAVCGLPLACFQAENPWMWASSAAGGALVAAGGDALAALPPRRRRVAYAYGALALFALFVGPMTWGVATHAYRTGATAEARAAALDRAMARGSEGAMRVVAGVGLGVLAGAGLRRVSRRRAADPEWSVYPAGGAVVAALALAVPVAAYDGAFSPYAPDPRPGGLFDPSDPAWYTRAAAAFEWGLGSEPREVMPSNFLRPFVLVVPGRIAALAGPALVGAALAVVAVAVLPAGSLGFLRLHGGVMLGTAAVAVWVAWRELTGTGFILDTPRPPDDGPTRRGLGDPRAALAGWWLLAAAAGAALTVGVPAAWNASRRRPTRART